MTPRPLVIAAIVVVLLAYAGAADAKAGKRDRTPATADAPAAAAAEASAPDAPPGWPNPGQVVPGDALWSYPPGYVEPPPPEPAIPDDGIIVHKAPLPRAAVATAGAAAPVAAAPREGSGVWGALAWALPLVGLGAIGAVVALRPKAPPAPRKTPAEPLPTDVRGLLARGQQAASRGALDEAIECFERVLKLAPGLGVALFCRGACLAANGRVAEAYGALHEAVRAKPDDAGYRIHFARAALALGKHHEAMDALAAVLRDVPELGPAMLDDPQLASLRDHPRFLMICGAL